MELQKAKKIDLAFSNIYYQSIIAMAYSAFSLGSLEVQICLENYY